MSVVSKDTTFLGYRRENGRVGVRNFVIVLPLDDLSNAAAEAVAHNIKGALAIPHPYGRLQFGEGYDLVKPLSNLGPPHSRDNTQQEDVLAPRQIVGQARPDVEQGTNSTPHLDLPFVGTTNAADQTQQSGLPGPV